MPAATPSERLAEYLNDPAAPVKLHLAKAELPTDQTTLLPADFVECDYVGYEAQTIDDFDSVIDPEEDVAEVLPTTRSFVGGDLLVTPQAIHAAYVCRHPDAGTVQLLAVVAYDPPLVMTKPGQVIDVVVRVTGLDF